MAKEGKKGAAAKPAAAGAVKAVKVAAPEGRAPTGGRSTGGTAQDGQKVKVHYTGKLDDGSVFDSSAGREPLEFTLGAHQVVPGFEDAVTGMSVGEKKTVTLEKDDAYGDPHPELIQEIPIEMITQAGIEPKEGMVLGMQHPQMPGQHLPARIVAVSEKMVKLDLNHPLAGKRLTFEIELVSVA